MRRNPTSSACSRRAHERSSASSSAIRSSSTCRAPTSMRRQRCMSSSPDGTSPQPIDWAGWPAMRGGRRRRSRSSLSAVKVLPPISDPDAILMAARNYAEHANEMAQAGRTAGTTTVIDEKVRSGIPGLWSSSGERSAAEPVPVSEAEVVARGRRRCDRAAPRPHAHRLRMRAGGRDREAGKARDGRSRAGLRVRIHGDDRCVGPRGSRGRTIRLRLADQQELRHLRAERAIHRARPVRRRSTEPCRSSTP